MEIKIASTTQEKEDALQVRFNVFVKEQHVPKHLEIDEFDKNAIHFVGYKQDQPVAAGRVRFLNHFGKIERLSVLKNYRGQHFGIQMIKEMEKEIIKNHYNHSLLHAQKHAIPFYEQLGYEASSDEFIDAGIIHVSMTKQLL